MLLRENCVAFIIDLEKGGRWIIMTNNRITAYEGSENYIFISYAHKDTDKVFPIMEKLCGRGYRLWYDDGIDRFECPEIT